MRIQIVETAPNRYYVPELGNRRYSGRAMYERVKARFGCVDGALHRLNGTITRVRFEPTGWRVEDEQPPCLQGDNWEASRPTPQTVR